MSFSIHAAASALNSASSLQRADANASEHLTELNGDDLDVEGWCGTVPRKLPVPPPSPLGPRQLGDLMRDVVGAPAQFGTQVGSEG
ncbi:MAG TPA: hypothetical protein VLJ62_24490 [Burkholderiaceae bacterium]|nr:hypothetical protein [Burkholderiaceae bacterium]